ncbi:E3 ubiquitin-protein ligase E3D [Saguinus oedipus]|uniref:E3 ubiquitin-protein ligase E3D n=1 Tax=Saguinus oedipus TaxID=9490 RepID=A0ABQ9VX87_SAGOE|nr:E3 ubiquitin-protein ligase E3D [Saguinus oedipus]
MPLDISIMPSSLQVKTSEGCTEIQLPAEVRLVPSSCRGLQFVAGDGLHLRLQAQAELGTIGQELISMFNQRLQAQECCTFYCQSCGEVIIKDSVPYLSMSQVDEMVQSYTGISERLQMEDPQKDYLD